MIPLLMLMLAVSAPVFAEDGGSRSASEAAPLDEPPAGPPLSGDEATQEARRIASGLRCPVCQGLSVADSNADAARAMKSRIDELVTQGYTEDQIVDYFVDRYGEFVRLEPEAEGMNLVLWLLPGGLVLGGLGWLLTSGRRRENEPGPDAAPPEPAAASADPHRAAVLADVGPPPIGGRA